MNKQLSVSLFALLAFILVSCKTSQTGTGLIIGDNYDEQKNETVLTILPYGGFNIPGKWTKKEYDSYTKQHFFVSPDSTNIALRKVPRNKYDFYKAGQTDAEFATAYAKWEGDYWAQKGPVVKTISNRAADGGYVLWQVKDSTGRYANSIILCGSKNNFGYQLIGDSKNRTEEQLQDFLTKLFLNN